MPSSKKLTPSDCNNHRQPEIATWLPKPEIVISLELQCTTDSVEITTASQVFLTIVSPNKVPLSDHWLWQCPTAGNGITAVKTGNTYTSWTMTGRMTIPTANAGFAATSSSKKLTPSDNRKWKHRRFGPKLAISGSRSLSKSFVYTFIELVIIKNPEFVVGISMLSVIVPQI